MAPVAALPDPPPSLFERSYAGLGPRAYWKCRIGRRVQLAREAAGVPIRDGLARQGESPRLAREDLARRLGLAPQRLWEIENGLTPIEGGEIALLGQALCVHPGYFFDDGPWSDWALDRAPGAGGKAGWLLAKTIGELEDRDRRLLEKLALRLAAHRAPPRNGP